ncbi:hypothetical protein [Novosphingobium sp.]|uniref:hypothetical protein n=1 Tax=Novosphingobium sp. TaxID=1874826 RepID=UPI003B515F36
MIKTVAIATCALVLASAAPACAQTVRSLMLPIQPIQASTPIGIRLLPGMNNGQVNRTIPGTPGLPGTVVNPDTGYRPGRTAAATPLTRDGLFPLAKASVGGANRRNGVTGQQGVAAVREVTGVRAVDSPPIRQSNGASRPVLSWQP